MVCPDPGCWPGAVRLRAGHTLAGLLAFQRDIAGAATERPARSPCPPSAPKEGSALRAPQVPRDAAQPRKLPASAAGRGGASRDSRSTEARAKPLGVQEPWRAFTGAAGRPGAPRTPGLSPPGAGGPRRPRQRNHVLP